MFFIEADLSANIAIQLLSDHHGQTFRLCVPVRKKFFNSSAPHLLK